MALPLDFLPICPDIVGFSPLAKRPIPVLDTVQHWQEILLVENSEPLIDLSNPQFNKCIIVESQYVRMNYLGAIETQFCREQVALRLMQAAALLPMGMRLKIWDAWRPLELQQDIFNRYLQVLTVAHTHLSHEELIQLCLRFVSTPSAHPEKPSPHYTGGSIDLTIITDDNRELWMGTVFDDFSEKANMRFYEDDHHVLSKEDRCARDNRRLLFQVMTTAGFTNYSDEWWHFDFGNQFWGKITRCPAFYGPIEPDF
jgi:zinc D-Ala-D-Ala dipeptidase